RPTLYAVGDSKLGQKWKSAHLKHQDLREAGVISGSTTDITHERTKPLEQIATYCRVGETRYGYVVTQDELVVLRARRIRKTGPNSTPQSAAFEYKAIPWAEHGQGNLTVNLAIWGLGSMEMNPLHRAMEKPNHDPLDMMARLTWWEPLDSQGKKFRNVISRRELDASTLRKISGGRFVVTQQDGNSYTNGF
ncbi:hypothetical protein F5883DRAFT_355517, partial [Diaporthe sp. PMI_573]